MAMVSVGQYKISAGKRDEALKAIQAARELHTKMGAKVRVWSLTAAGPNSGTFSYTTEFADYRAYQDFIDKMQTQTVRPLADAMAVGTITMVSGSHATEMV
jgi:cytochrome c oxidase assembly factor CtaG